MRRGLGRRSNERDGLAAPMEAIKLELLRGVKDLTGILSWNWRVLRRSSFEAKKISSRGRLGFLLL